MDVTSLIPLANFNYFNNCARKVVESVPILRPTLFSGEFRFYPWGKPMQHARDNPDAIANEERCVSSGNVSHTYSYSETNKYRYAEMRVSAFPNLARMGNSICPLNVSALRNLFGIGT